MKIELMNNSTSCDYHASEPDYVYNLKSLICLYDVSLLPINLNLEYKIFDKNDKKLSKELKSWKRNLEIKYEFVKKEGKYFYRPFVELDLDLSKESKNDDFVELKFSYERFKLLSLLKQKKNAKAFFFILFFLLSSSIRYI